MPKPFKGVTNDVARRRGARACRRGAHAESMPKGRAVSTAAVAIDGADSKGKANDKEVCGDAAAVSQRRSEALRRRAAAIQERLDKIKPVAKAPVSAAALAADRAAMQRIDGIAAKTAGKVATDEHTFDQFVDEQAVRLEEGGHVCTRRQRRWWRCGVLRGVLFYLAHSY